MTEVIDKLYRLPILNLTRTNTVNFYLLKIIVALCFY
ncbi:hypothetical protein VP496E541_P0133 [Vibrio phage 496E54-1]|nr:hypothetical protein VP495E541_P0132 [Vibrio phage 495E54-1]CAH9013860.1 hypothetical protein VP496E541_P0133 [Vibrio phage 496E54-1]